MRFVEIILLLYSIEKKIHKKLKNHNKLIHMTYFLIALVVIAIIVLNPYIFRSAPKGLVMLMFKEYVPMYKMIIETSDNRFNLGNNVFTTKNDAQAFILSSIFNKRISPNERKSVRFEVETEELKQPIEFESGGKKISGEIYRFTSLGDLICAIWYIESGLRANTNYGEFTYNYVQQMSLLYDDLSSKIITKEYRKQLSLNPEVIE